MSKIVTAEEIAAAMHPYIDDKFTEMKAWTKAEIQRQVGDFATGQANDVIRRSVRALVNDGVSVRLEIKSDDGSGPDQ